MMDRGTYIEYEGRPAVRFERSYPHPAERVFAAVTDPQELAHWFPCTVKFAAHVGAAIEFFDDPNTEPTTGSVIEYDPPLRFAFDWAGDELIFDITPTGADSCTLALINILADRDAAARNAAGWTVCLGELDKHIAGQPTGGPHSDTAQPWRPVYEAYLADGLPHGAPIPGGS